MTYQYLSRRVKNVADKAGVDRDRVSTHNFRKTAASRWIREGLSEQAIKHRTCWDVDTDMFKVYSGVRDEELNDQILSHYDIDTGEDDSSEPTVKPCQRCGATVRVSNNYCPECAAPLNQKAANSSIRPNTISPTASSRLSRPTRQSSSQSSRRG